MRRARTTYLAAVGGGLGDMIVALPVFRALIRQEKVIVVMRTQRQMGFEELIPGLSGSIQEPVLAKRTLEPEERYINLRAHRLQTDYFWGGPEFERDYPSFKINDILGEMCRDLGINADFQNLVPFPFTKLPELDNAIICIPGTTVDPKSWAASNWMKLRPALEKMGFKVYMLGQPEHSEVVRELHENNFPLLQTPEIRDAVDILSSARAVVSVDTGLMHLAVQQGTATISLFQDPIYYRPYANAFMLLSKHCADACVEERMSARPQDTTVEKDEFCWYNGKFKTCQVSEEERCINSISVSDVLQCLRTNVLTRERQPQCEL